jgi:sugar phosphate isomerase/epimerase
VRAAQELVRLGASVGADMVCIRPTSMVPNRPWSPHPLNYAPETEQRLVESLYHVTRTCADYGMPIALECHVTTTLHDPATSRRIIEQVGSRWLKVNLDPANFACDHLTAYDTTGLLNNLFDTLGPYALAAHVKDVLVEDEHVVHISETQPGTGLMDFETFLRRFEALLPDGYALIEHLPPEQIPPAAAFVQQKLRELNIAIKE